MSLKTILITYLIGGLTLPPLLIALVLYLVYTTAPKFIDVDERDDDLSDLDEYHSLKLTALEEAESTGVKAYKTGWITVTREYHHFVSNATEKNLEQKDSSGNGGKSAYTALYRLVKNKKEGKESNGKDSDSASVNSNGGTVTKTVKKKNRYFAVLKHGNLFLYKNEDQRDVQHVIVLSNNIVTIWPRNLRDGELFTKKTAICLLKREAKKKADTPPRSSAASLDDREQPRSTYEILESGLIPPGSMGFFIYCDTNYEKEDWYFELIKATKREKYEPSGTDLDQIEPSVYANAMHFKTADMISLIQTLHSSEGQLQTRWLNAFIGRIFLALQDTDFFERVVETKLLKKLAKINRPGFLEEFQVKKVDIGNAAPFISFPKLETLNPDGSLRVSFNFTYTGKLSLQVATKANISLGSAFKTREVGLLLAVTVNRLEGPLVISVKPPPSSRIWYTFEKMPDMDMTIEPVVSQRSLTYGMITKAIENKFRDAIKESLVEPYWDDMSFFDTSDEFYRGGIWDTKKRPPKDIHHAEDDEIAKAEHDEKEMLAGELEHHGEIPEEESEEIEDELTAVGEDDVGKTNDAQSHSETASLRSRGSQILKSKASFNNISGIAKKKTDASIVTSDEQYLADGSYVARDQVKSSETSSTTTSRSSTMQMISGETAAGKKAISTGIKKIGKWYNEAKNKEKVPYTPPEMISRRRATSNTSDKGKSRSSSTTDLNEAHHKNAPQPHSFPAEYLYGLDTQRPDSESDTKSVPPTKIADMKSPYSANSERGFTPLQSPMSGNSDLVITPTSPKRHQLPRRKPVDESLSATTQEPDSGLSQAVSDASTAKLEPASAPLEPPVLPTRAPPPALPPRSAPATVDPAPVVAKIPPPLPSRESVPESVAGSADVSHVTATVETTTEVVNEKLTVDTATDDN